MPDIDQIVVKSHVGRDLLQSSAFFTTAKLVVWEYVANGLQYVDPGINPVVSVTIDSKAKRIVVKDNGAGMDMEGLNNFFVMHGENQDRKKGKAGRGMFGTGKSAAFGIADSLRLTTVRNGQRFQIELHRADIEKYDSGENIPTHVVERGVLTNEPNGTVIEIDKIHLRTINQRDVIEFIERHLSRWNKGVKVFVNNHLCEFSEPPTTDVQTFTAGAEFGSDLEGAKATIKIATAPLDEDLRGVSIFSNGVWHETTLAGNEKEMTQYIFGEIDVPRLDSDTSPIAPINQSRSMRLNVENELVRNIYAFLNTCIEQVRKKLVEAEKERKSQELSRRLEQQANEIADIINQDFHHFSHEIAKVKAQAAGAHDYYAGIEIDANSPHGESVIFGADIPATIISDTGGPGADGDNGVGGKELRNLAPQVEQAADEEPTACPVAEQKKLGRRGGFNIEFRNMGAETYRARYVSDERTIFINLDHAQLTQALSKRTVDDVVFKRLAYEIAFTEYAIALSSELAGQGAYLDPFDPIADIRETIQRIADKSAHLYAD